MTKTAEVHLKTLPFLTYSIRLTPESLIVIINLKKIIHFMLKKEKGMIGILTFKKERWT